MTCIAPSQLSCIKMNASTIAHAYGLTRGSWISLRCIAAVIWALANTCRSVRPSKGISVQTIMSPHHTVQLRQCYSLHNFLPGSPHHSTSIISRFSETALICEEYWPPVAKLPVLMLASKVESQCTVLRSETWVLGRSSGSDNIIMESIPNNLVGQVNFSSTTDVNFQRFSCAHVIATRQQYKKKVLHWGHQPWTTLPMSPTVLSSLLVTYLYSVDYARGQIKYPRYHS